jgi:hypothetical protein
VRHFLFEDREYRYRLNFSRRKEGPDSARALARLLSRKPPRRSGGRGGGQKKTDLRQKCVVKAQYSYSAEAHSVQLEKYLVREGTDRNGNRAVLYGSDTDEYRNNMAEKNFRVFLSPQSDRADLSSLASRFVRKLELQTGYRLYWQAANHYNTAHPHVHLLINGKDKNGKDVVFPRDVVKTFMRETARDLCTSQLGTRARADLAAEREKEISAPRFTRLDERIRELCGGTFRPSLDGRPKDRERVLARLECLRGMKLCVYQGGGYRLSPRWEEDLKANGRYNAFLKAREALVYTAPQRLRVYTGGEGAVSGRVTKIYRTDGDASDSHAVVLETFSGDAFFIPLLKKPEAGDGGKRTPLEEGEFITVKAYASQRGRLTPSLFRQGLKQARREVKRLNIAGKLADAALAERDAPAKAREKHRNKSGGKTNDRG